MQCSIWKLNLLRNQFDKRKTCKGKLNGINKERMLWYPSETGRNKVGKPELLQSKQSLSINIHYPPLHFPSLFPLNIVLSYTLHVMKTIVLTFQLHFHPLKSTADLKPSSYRWSTFLSLFYINFVILL